MGARILFFGDSLTEGSDGASYLAAVEARLAALPPTVARPTLLNAGVGGDTVWNLARRLPQAVVPQAPDWVVVFIGVNDAAAWWAASRLPTPAHLRTRRYFRETKGVRRPTAPQAFADGLRTVCDGLALRTSARVALCTPALNGESPHAPQARLLAEYAAVVRQVAAERDLALVDVHAACARALAALPPRPLAARLAARLAVVAPAPPPATPEACDALARRRGLTLTYDGVHLTTRGAAVVAEEVLRWLHAAVLPAE